jgi:hypothetical protein
LTEKQNPVFDHAMKIKTALLTLAVSLLAAAACLAADPQMGTWKLNESKSKIAAGTTKNHTVVYSGGMMGKVKITVDGVDKDGKATHNEWTGKFDGKDYAVSGDTSQGDMRSYTKVNDRTLEMTVKKDGKVTATGRIVIAPDGKSRTVTVNGTTAKGKKFKNVVVYDKA